MPSDFKSVISGYTAEASKYSAEGFAAFSTIGFFFAAYGCRASKVHPAVSAGFALTGFIASTIVKDLTTSQDKKLSLPHMFSISALGGFASPLLKKIPIVVKVINTLKKYNFINVFFAPLPWIQLGLAASQVYASIPRVYLNLIEEDEESTDAAPLNIGEPTGVQHLGGSSTFIPISKPNSESSSASSLSSTSNSTSSSKVSKTVSFPSSSMESVPNAALAKYTLTPIQKPGEASTTSSSSVPYSSSPAISSPASPSSAGSFSTQVESLGSSSSSSGSSLKAKSSDYLDLSQLDKYIQGSRSASTSVKAGSLVSASTGSEGIGQSHFSATPIFSALDSFADTSLQESHSAPSSPPLVAKHPHSERTVEESFSAFGPSSATPEQNSVSKEIVYVASDNPEEEESSSNESAHSGKAVTDEERTSEEGSASDTEPLEDSAHPNFDSARRLTSESTDIEGNSSDIHAADETT